MKKDYLWDKTGADAEIENLEKALNAFRYKESAPPVLPVKVWPFQKKPARRSFRFAYAIAACAAFAMVGFGFWYEASNNQIEIQEMLTASIVQPIRETPPEIPVIYNTDDSAPAQIENPIQIPARKTIKTIKAVEPNFVSYKAKEIKKIEAKNAEARLTKEEKYAYDQLMLALSITSSKLKMVKDKVEGVEQETVSEEKAR